eukprot:jgi/Bigna1/84671/fgenesh1_pg.202_\
MVLDPWIRTFMAGAICCAVLGCGGGSSPHGRRKREKLTASSSLAREHSSNFLPLLSVRLRGGGSDSVTEGLHDDIGGLNLLGSDSETDFAQKQARKYAQRVGEYGPGIHPALPTLTSAGRQVGHWVWADAAIIRRDIKFLSNDKLVVPATCKICLLIEIWDSLVSKSADPTKVLRNLLDRGENPDEEDSKGEEWTPLTRAALAGNVEAAKILLEYGAMINKLKAMDPPLSTSQHKEEENPLVYNQQKSVPASLGTQWQSFSSAAVPMMRMLLENKANVSSRTIYGDTPILIAAKRNQRTFRLLMDFGASKNDQNARRACAIDAAHFYTPDRFDPESTMKEGITPLIAAASKGRVDTVFALLRFEDVDVNMHSSNHITALHAASLEGHLEVMDILLDHGATLECPNKDGCTPVFMAAQNNHTKALRWLIKVTLCAALVTDTVYRRWTRFFSVRVEGGQHGADVETQRFDGTTALQIAISEKHTYVARMLIQAGANVNGK